jgi:hypothetical protein
VILQPLLVTVKSLWLWLRPAWRAVVEVKLIWIIWLVWGVLIFRAAEYENVLWLSAGGRGLLEHYSFWASFLVGPTILTLTRQARDYFLRFSLLAVEQHATDSGKTIIWDEISPAAERSRRSLSLYFILLFLIMLGVAFSASAYSKLRDPLQFWGNDVFNSRNYRLSSLAANSYLTALWSIVYPVAAFHLIQTAVSVQRVVQEATQRDVLRLDLLHPDGCGGLAQFGNLNMKLVFLHLLPAVPIVMLYFTHEKQYFSGAEFALGLLFLVALQSFFGLWRLRRVIELARNTAIHSWNDRIRHLLKGKGLGSTEALVALRYRDCLVAVRSFPYEKSALFIMAALQVVLAVWAIVATAESTSGQQPTKPVQTLPNSRSDTNHHS